MAYFVKVVVNYSRIKVMKGEIHMELKEILDEHNDMYENYDLGSPKIIQIDIKGDIAILTNSNNLDFGKQVKIQDLGKEIAETIMLETQAFNCEYGSFIANQDLPSYSNILKYKEEDFDFNVELFKLWHIARIICCMKRDPDITYTITYDSDSGITMVEERR